MFVVVRNESTWGDICFAFVLFGGVAVEGRATTNEWLTRSDEARGEERRKATGERTEQMEMKMDAKHRRRASREKDEREFDGNCSKEEQDDVQVGEPMDE